MFDLGAFLTVAAPPPDQSSTWLEAAKDGVKYLTGSAQAAEVILYANVGQAFIHSVLVPVANVTPPDADDLGRAYSDPCSQWTLEHVSGGGEPDRMFLARPIRECDCKSYRGGEKLVFRRKFAGVDKGPVRTELSQPLVQALDLYWLDEFRAYCRLDEDGDVASVIKLYDVSARTGNADDVLVTIVVDQLHRYMAVTEMALVMKFDFTRFTSGSFAGWVEPSREDVEGSDLFYHTGVQAGASFANGSLIIRPVFTKKALIARENRRWQGTEDDYAFFKAHDWKNRKLARISCAPSALASYFDKGSSLPFQTTPAFFKAEVLQRYKADPDKYRLEARSIHSRGGWFLKSYDVNEAGQVHVYLCDLGRLPHREQLYWQAFNEWPKAGISERAYQTDFEGNFSTVPDPLENLKRQVACLDEAKPNWWSPRGEDAAAVLHYPVTASPEEWANAVLALDQLVVEGFVLKALRVQVAALGGTFDKQWGTIRLLQEHLSLAGMNEIQVSDLLQPLRETHNLRSKVKGHLAEGARRAIVAQACAEHGSLARHFRALAETMRESLAQISSLLR